MITTKTASDYQLAARTKTAGVEYHVIHKASGKVKSKCSTRARARNRLDKLDNEWGSYAHTIIKLVDGQLEGICI